MRNKSIKLESLTFIVVLHLKADNIDLSRSIVKATKILINK